MLEEAAGSVWGLVPEIPPKPTLAPDPRILDSYGPYLTG